jgi:hydrogenase nickel incorporation protein HypA/HybF
MHELSLIADLMRKLEAIEAAQRPGRILGVTLRVGILAHLSADHLREHFLRASRGTAAQGAQLAIEVVTDLSDPQAEAILLDSVEVEG